MYWDTPFMAFNRKGLVQPKTSITTFYIWQEEVRNSVILIINDRWEKSVLIDWSLTTEKQLSKPWSRCAMLYSKQWRYKLNKVENICLEYIFPTELDWQQCCETCWNHKTRYQLGKFYSDWHYHQMCKTSVGMWLQKATVYFWQHFIFCFCYVSAIGAMYLIVSASIRGLAPVQPTSGATLPYHYQLLRQCQCQCWCQHLHAWQLLRC